jgi:hypothetical protein
MEGLNPDDPKGFRKAALDAPAHQLCNITSFMLYEEGWGKVLAMRGVLKACREGTGLSLSLQQSAILTRDERLEKRKDKEYFEFKSKCP